MVKYCFVAFFTVKKIHMFRNILEIHFECQNSPNDKY